MHQLRVNIFWGHVKPAIEAIIHNIHDESIPQATGEWDTNSHGMASKCLSKGPYKP